MNPTPSAVNMAAESAPESKERWGTWEDAEFWRKESFLRRTPAQRLEWLEEMMDFARIGKQRREEGWRAVG